MKATYEDAKSVLSHLNANTYKAYFAGGCVRDMVLGLVPNDYDICTSATPEQVQSLFERTIPVGASFGVVKVVVDGSRELDVATFRKDGQYEDGRHPETVEYTTSEEEDVKRRDFTINGLLMDANGEVFDYVGGKADLKNRILRTVGNPKDRFGEDALRMMRAIRFAIRFKMDIDPQTWEAIYDMSEGIKNVSKERITDEITKTFAYGNCDRAYILLHQSHLWEHIVTEDFPRHDSNWSSLFGLRRVQPGDPLILVLAIITAVSSSYATNRILESFTLTNEQKRDFSSLTNRHNEVATFLIKSLSQQRNILQWENLALIEKFLEYQRDLSCRTYTGDKAAVDAAKAAAAAMGWPGPLINGDTLQEFGFFPGPIFTEMLELVRTEQLENRLTKLEDVKPFLIATYPAAKRKLDNGAIHDGTLPRRMIAPCPNCSKPMSCLVSKNERGIRLWSDVTERYNMSSWDTVNFFFSSCCHARKKKALFVEAQV